MSMFGRDSSLLDVCLAFDREIETDLAGATPLPKMFLMAFLAELENLKFFVELGVYRGRSFFPTASVISRNGGRSCGIDPYCAAAAMEHDLDEPLRSSVNEFLKARDFEQIFREICRLRERSGFSESVAFLRNTAEDANAILLGRGIEIDLLHIDGNHDTKYVARDYDSYGPLVKEGGFIIFDDIDWKSVRGTWERAKEELVPVFETETFGILQKSTRLERHLIIAEKLQKKLKFVFEKLSSVPKLQPDITVGIITYNHVHFIDECLRSIINQRGEFNLRIVVCDDCSNDGTSERIEALLDSLSPQERAMIEHVRHSRNAGMVSTLADLISRMKGSDYFALIDGDDYYASPERLSRHLLFHTRNPETVLTFNNLTLYHQEQKQLEKWESDSWRMTYRTEDLIDENHIGNIGAGFYDGAVLERLGPELFQSFTGDWFLNICVSQFGKVARLPEALSVYRKHDEGLWNSMSTIDSFRIVSSCIGHYNSILDFAYDKEFTDSSNKRNVLVDGTAVMSAKLLILDDVFPHPLSGFRYEEYTSLLHEFSSARVFSSGSSVSVLGKEALEDLLVGYKRKFPQLGHQVQRTPEKDSISVSLLYGMFLSNTVHSLLPRAQATDTPFAFTLYPGGGFGLGYEWSDGALRRIFDSPWFRKVIVTQKITEEYLVSEGFCDPDDIDFVFGVVVPLDKLHLRLESKQRFGFEKKTLDICFVAHRYTPTGEDKGYGTFLETARILSRAGRDVRFHVVGPFDETVLDVSGIRNLHFYGSQPQDWFDEFYRDKDIIISPNKPFLIYKGNFDGFPTGCATDAALRGVAMFCSDPLDLNRGVFKDGIEIVIIEAEAEAIAAQVEYYLRKPEALKTVGEAGCRRCREVYSYERQIAPRVSILRNIINGIGDLDCVTPKTSDRDCSRYRV